MNKILKDIDFECRKSAAYHEDRARFLASINSVKKLASMVASSALLIPIVHQVPAALTYLAGMTLGILTMLDYVHDFSKWAALHVELKVGYNELRTRLAKSPKDTGALEVEVARLHGKEPARYFYVLAHAYNRTIDEVGAPTESKIQLQSWQVSIRNLWPAAGDSGLGVVAR